MDQKNHPPTGDYTPMRTSFGLMYGSTILVLAAFIVSGIWFTSHISGLSSAINIAGSQRMRVFQIAFYVTRSMNESSPEREETLGHVSMEMDRFGEIMNALREGGTKYNLSGIMDPELVLALLEIIHQWEEEFKPRLNAIMLARPEDSVHLLGNHDLMIHDFAERNIDHLVGLLVAKMDRAEHLFSTILYFLTILGIILVGINLLYVRRKILKPLRVLLADTEEVARGNYTVIAEVDTSNEIKLFAERFNTMTLAISRVFAEMEETVRRRTAEMQIVTARMQSFFDSAPDAILSINPEDKTIILFSRGAEKMFGYTREEVFGKNINMLMPEPYHSNHDTYVNNYINSGVKKIIGSIREVKARRKNGEIFEINLSVSESRTETGRVFNAIIRDTSAKVKAEREMQKLSNAVEQSAESVVITDRKGIIEYVNPAFERVTGYSAAEVLGHNPRILKSGQQSKEFYKDMWATIVDGNIWRGEFVNRKKSGDLYYEEATIAPIRDGQGEVTHFVAMKNDITMRKSAELDLAEKNSELQARLVYDKTFARVATLFSTTFDRQFALEKMLALLAEDLPFPCSAFYSFDEWVGKLVCEASYGIPTVLIRDFDQREGIVGQAVADGHVLVIEGSDQFPLLIETGVAAIKPQAIILQPILYQEKIMGVLVVGATVQISQYDRDFMARIATNLGVALQNLKQYSDLKDLFEQLKLRGREVAEKNTQLEEANRLKSEFLANMSHELRTPLNAIIGFSEVLRDEIMGELNETQQEYATDILTSGQHLLSLINDILDLSKIEAGMMTLDLEPVDIKETLENSLTVIKEKAMSHQIRLVLEIDDGIGEIEVDARKFKQIIYNLLANAVKFTPDGGSVSIGARRLPGITKGGPDSLQVSITDTGIGISQKNIGRLFRAFVQVDGSYSRKFEGTGLGLAMVKELVELHDGKISVESVVDQGSTFTVLLPYREVGSSEGEVALPLTDTISSLPSPLRHPAPEIPLVLIVEDDDQASELLRLQLEENSYKTARAATAEQGLKMALDLRPDLITLDIMLPGMDGWQFMEKIKADSELAQIPVVVISMVADKKKGFSLGAAEVLQKPVTKEALLQSVFDLSGMATLEGRPLKILVVDDDPKAVEIAGRHLEGVGHQVLRTYGGQEAIEVAGLERPDLVISDLMMPEISGFDVVHSLRNNPVTAAIPIIILTAKIITVEDRKILEGSMVKIVQKTGFRPTTFLEDVKKAVTGRQEKIFTSRPPSAPSQQGDLTPVAVTTGREAEPKKEPPLVLVVNDNPRESDLIRLYLTEQGFQVMQAGNGREALEIMAAARPDLITLDMMMPEMNGFQVLEELKKQKETYDIPVIILTAKILTKEERESLAAQVQSVIEKAQLTREDFLQEVGRLLGRRVSSN